VQQHCQKQDILSDSADFQLDHFLHYTPKLGILVEMVQFLLKLVETVSCCAPQFPFIFYSQFQSLYVKKSELEILQKSDISPPTPQPWSEASWLSILECLPQNSNVISVTSQSCEVFTRVMKRVYAPCIRVSFRRPFTPNSFFASMLPRMGRAGAPKLTLSPGTGNPRCATGRGWLYFCTYTSNWLISHF